MHLRQGKPDLRRDMPPWLRALDKWMPCAPTTYVSEERNTSDAPVYGYTIGGLGWHDGGRNRTVHQTRLGAVIATWEWWLTTESSNIGE